MRAAIYARMSTDKQSADIRADSGQLEWNHYTQLCMAKHANPLFQQREVVSMAPEAGEQTVRTAWYALGHGARLALTAIAQYKQHVPENRFPREEYNQVLDAWKRLNTRAIDRWGREDPYPGQWKNLKREAK